tara:strand:+ start:8865 stop:9806 length:942 start_codon:yes stop_codon:yes gene_type:complete
MNVLLFPGQGSQIVGMGSEFYNKFDFVKKIFRKADERLGFSLSKMILEGPTDELQLTKNTQPAILTVSYSIFTTLMNEYNLKLKDFKYFAGHSLGEYSALVCAEALKFEDAIYLLHERGKAMQDAVPVGKGLMVAVLGLNIEEVKDFINKQKSQKGVCEIANDNALGQVILSGDYEKIKSLQVYLKEKKVKTIPLKVSAPFHCSLMMPAAQNMSKKINETEFRKPLIEIINNVFANIENEPEIIKKNLIEQIYSTVKWKESIEYMKKKGIKNFIEIGPGKALTGMVKRTIKDVNCFSINSLDDIKNLNDELQK